ncbi:MAG: vWA domain-containing protein [Candidatus Korobacteraceae bacterium]
MFAMVVDISGSDAEQKQSIRKAALEIFQALSKSGNQGYLTLFNEEVAISGAPITPERAESNLEKVFFHGGTALYDAIRQTADKLNESKNQNFHRRLMVVVSDGEDNASRLSAKQLEPIVQKDGVAVYVLLIPVKHSGTQVDHVKAISRDSGGT